MKTFKLQPIYGEIVKIKFCTNGVLDDNIFKDFVSDKCANTRVSIDKDDLKCYVVARIKNSKTLHIFEYF